EASWAAGGMLAPQSEADASDPFFELACASRDAYPAFADALLAETGVDIELDRTGTLYLAFDEQDEAEIERRYAWQQRAGLAVESLTATEARTLEPQLSTRVRAALLFPRDGQVENRRLVAALKHALEVYGVRVFEQTQAKLLHVERGRVVGVETARGLINADAFVIACGAWSSLVPFEFTPARDERLVRDESIVPTVEPVRGQMLCFDARPALTQHVLYSPRGYLVPRRDG